MADEMTLTAKQIKAVRESLRPFAQAARDAEIEMECKRFKFRGDALAASELPDSVPTLGAFRKALAAYELLTLRHT